MRRFILDPKKPPKLSEEERTRLDAMTDDEITAAAESDPDNPPLTDEELERVRRVQAVRAHTGLSRASICRNVSDQRRTVARSGARADAA